MFIIILVLTSLHFHASDVTAPQSHYIFHGNLQTNHHVAGLQGIDHATGAAQKHSDEAPDLKSASKIQIASLAPGGVVKDIPLTKATPKGKAAEVPKKKLSKA